ncbi:phosphoribosylanthranilate isomerase [Granulicella rosea]|uniref:N-(5'-phosphoribosyl)anthranilate isomerase n=1 Tax=Granulicella rosea TaxID=474952 RepID=A0A239LKH2_9BACT|nr:phosphoribosylanthranilate isomerase [Granulicella rosea]SNT31066.1 phosphoribosylanthranilate isomerase [Granulicella rosea]
MWIKICANTNLDDALMAAELGADAVGFVFAPSKRQVTVEQVAAITPHLPRNVERIGVFTTTSDDEIIQIVGKADLTGVQLHGGHHDAEYISRLGARPGENYVEVIRTASWVVNGDEESDRQAAELLLQLAHHTRVDTRILLDSKVKDELGGTGIAFNWAKARAVIDSDSRLKAHDIILAGGLNPENVADAIRALHPWGVDVASGVEEVPGRKAPERLKRFIEAARAVRL